MLFTCIFEIFSCIIKLICLGFLFKFFAISVHHLHIFILLQIKLEFHLITIKINDKLPNLIYKDLIFISLMNFQLLITHFDTALILLKSFLNFIFLDFFKFKIIALNFHLKENHFIALRFFVCFLNQKSRTIKFQYHFVILILRTSFQL